MMILLSLLFIILSLILVIWKRKLPNFPPGPTIYPIIGSLASLMKIHDERTIQQIFMDLGEKYGPLVGFYLGSQPCVVVNGYEAVKHVLSREDCTRRPDTDLFRMRSFNKRLGLVFSDGNLWKENRRFTLRHLRDFGFGKQSMESLIHEEIITLMENIDKQIESTHTMNCVGIKLQDLFPIPIINILWEILAGKRYDHENLQLKKLIPFVEDFFRNGSPTGGIVTVWPILRYVPIINSKFKKIIKSAEELQKFMKVAIDEHKERYDENYMRDYIDIFIREIKHQENNEHTNFTEEQLIILCMDLFLAGTETTSSLLSFIFLYMMLYPEVQEKMRKEIIQVIGPDRLPCIEDGPKLHYVQAVILEVLRHSTLTPFTVNHVTENDTNLLQYQVPKDTILMINLYSVMMEKTYWGDPEIFNPERFIDANGIFHKDEHVITFGYGPRMCMGETLARHSTLLFLTTLLQRYSCSLPTGVPKPSMNHLQGFTTSPRPYTIVLNKH